MAENIQTVEQPVAAPTISQGTSLLSALGLDAEQVMQGPNISQTLKAPVGASSDVLGIFTGQDEAFGVPALEKAFQTSQKNFLDAQNLANQQQLTIQGRRKKLGVVRGEQAEAGAQANMDLQTLQTAQTLASSALQSAQQKAAQRASILYNEYQTKLQLTLEFPGLDINPLTDDFNKVSDKLKDYQEDKKKEAEKDAYKKALRDMGLKTKGSRKELEKRLIKANKSAADMVKKQNDLQMQQLEMAVAKAKKSLQPEPSVDEQLNEIWGDNNNGGGNSVDSYFDSLGYGSSISMNYSPSSMS